MASEDLTVDDFISAGHCANENFKATMGDHYEDGPDEGEIELKIVQVIKV
jgi:hypothetical protein